MRPYEAMVILKPDLDPETLQAVQNRLTSVITDNGGQITHIDPWGKRRLAYEIKGYNEGFYVVIKFQGEPGITVELERIMRITDAVMRFLVVRDEFPTAPPSTAAKPEAAGVQTEATAAEEEGTETGEAQSDAAGEVDAAGGAETAAEQAEAERAVEEAEPAEEKQN